MILFFAQMLIFAGIKAFLAYVFWRNAGSFVEWHFFDNIQFIEYNYSLECAMAIVGMVLLASYKWKEKPLFLRGASLIILPLFVLTLFLAVITELRGYYEFYPIFAGLCVHTISNLWGISVPNVEGSNC